MITQEIQPSINATTADSVKVPVAGLSRSVADPPRRLPWVRESAPTNGKVERTSI